MSITSRPSIRLVVQTRACWAWYIATMDASAMMDIRIASCGFVIASASLPAAIAGAMTSLCHQAPSCSAIRRVQSPSTRSRRSIATGRNPAATWASTKRTVGSSSSRSRSSGDGWARPVASRMIESSSSGTPVRALACPNVSSERAAKRS